MTKIKNYFTNKIVLKALLAILLYYIIFEGLGALVSYIINISFSKEFIANNLYPLNLALQYIVYLPIITAIFILFRKDLVADFKDVLDKSYHFSKNTITGLLIMYGVNVVASFLVTIIGITGTSENQESIEGLLMFSWYAPILFTPLICFFGPLVEEVIFRKCFRNVILNDYLFIGISTFLFGFMHVITTPGSFGYKLGMAIPYFASGFTFSFLYVKNGRNIVIPTICHVLNNTLATIFILILR